MNRKIVGAIVAVVVVAAVVIVVVLLRNADSNTSYSTTTSHTDSMTGDKHTPDDQAGSGGHAMHGAQSDTPPSDEVSSGDRVVIEDFAYGPQKLTVKKGTTVTWTNNDTADHTVTAGDGSGPMSELFGKGQSYSYTFSTVGTFNYFCEPHPYMKGTVVVIE
jgi:plastocyanin